jgi:hypothetical protein
MIATILYYCLLLYVAIGLLTAFLFVTLGLARVLAPGTSVTAPARILFIPGAAALWPYVLVRWLTARGAA